MKPAIYAPRYENTNFKARVSLPEYVHNLGAADRALVATVRQVVLPDVREGTGYYDFISSVIGQFEKRGLLSPAQRDKLNAAVTRHNETRLPPITVLRPQVNAPAREPTLVAVQQLLQKVRAHGKQWPSIKFSGYLLTLAGPTSKVPGSVNVLSADRDTWFGRFNEGVFLWSRDATLEERDEISTWCRALGEDPAKTAAQYGHETGSCCFCTSPLTDARSVTAGYGPICADNYGLPWGD